MLNQFHTLHYRVQAMCVSKTSAMCQCSKDIGLMIASLSPQYAPGPDCALIAWGIH